MALERTSDYNHSGMLRFRTFREFPWQNGLVLHGSRLEEVFRTWSKEPPKRYPDIEMSILEVSLVPQSGGYLN
jgi:hypothetical protein